MAGSDTNLPWFLFLEIHHLPLSDTENKKYLICICTAIPVLVLVNGN